MTGKPPVRFELDPDGVAMITLDAPKLNLYNLEMRDQLIEALHAVRLNPAVRSVVVRACGAHFSAGADLSEFGTASTPLDARRIRWERDPWTLLYELPVPTVVALHGYAIGAGIELALLCDLRYAAESTVVALPEVEFGMLPAAGGTQSLTRVVGASRARPIILSGRRLSADDALREGLVHGIVPDVDDHALRVARRLATLNPVAMRYAVANVRGLATAAPAPTPSVSEEWYL